MRLAFPSSRFRAPGRSLPARLMKHWIMRMPEPIPLGLTFLLAMVRAMVSASFVNRLLGGEVETVFTPRTHCFFPALAGLAGFIVVSPECDSCTLLRPALPGRAGSAFGT